METKFKKMVNSVEIKGISQKRKKLWEMPKFRGEDYFDSS